MAFLGKLEYEDEEYQLTDFSIALTAMMDTRGRRTTSTQGGELHFSIPSEGYTTFFDLMFTGRVMEEGKFIFFKGDNMSSLREITFKNAYCIAVAEQFNSGGNSPLSMRISISAAELTITGNASEAKIEFWNN